MTLEGQAPGPDETPVPPARTRWSEEPADDDPGLMPPYVPGGAEAASSAGAPPEPERDPWAGPPEPPAQPAPGTSPQASPGGMPEPSPEAGPPAPDPSAPAEGEPFPFDAGGGDAFPFEGGGGGGGDDEFPFHAFDIGSTEERAPVEAEIPAPAPEPFVPDSLAAEPEVGPSRSADLAARLQGLAEALRTEGRLGLEREMVTGDRFTSLVAGVVAGYLSGLEE